jgi:predicted aspartyl protease
MKTHKIILLLILNLIVNCNLFSQCIEGNCENGIGKYVYEDKSYYEGQWKASRKHGKGKYVFSSGDVYEGNYVDNTKSGQGILNYANGDIYEGNFIDNSMSGQGIYNFANGDKELGTFTNGLLNGKGIKTYKNGDKYDGIWKDGGFVSGSGKIVYTYDNNYSYYEGELILHEGKITPHGRGYAFLRDSKSKTGPFWTFGSPSKALISQSKIPSGKWAIELNEEGKVFEVKGIITNANHLLSKDFILDTGASYVSLPWSTVVELINQKIITSKDFIGQVSLKTATGEIMEGKKFIINEIYFNVKNNKGETDKISIYNVEAVVNSNETELIKSALGLSETPTLLGQSALSKLERFEIDYKTNLLILNNER